MSPAPGPALCPGIPTGPGLGCKWAGREAGREKCWVPGGNMRPELQVAVRCELGRLSLASAAREVPPDPAPRSCPARPEPPRERPLLAPQPAALSRGPQELWIGDGVRGRAVGQGGGLLLSWHWALQEPGCLLPALNPTPPRLSHLRHLPPNTSLRARNSTRAGLQAAHAPWGSDASGGRGLEHPLASSLRLQLNPECASGGSHVTGCHCGGGSRGRRGRGGAEITPPGRHDKSHLQSSNT